MEKKCFKCGEVKSLTEFYKHPQMSDGHVNKCKECNKKDVRNNRKENVEYYRLYDRSRGNRQGKAYRDSYKARYPNKYRAKAMVEYAVKSGKLKRGESCEKCGSTFAIHGHHDDYQYPLTVRWLCAVCHRQWHDQNGQAPNGE